MIRALPVSIVGKALLFTLLTLLVPRLARANLGDSVQDIISRYGKPSGYAEAGAQGPFGRIIFRAGAYELLLFIYNNREVGARVSKLDHTDFRDDEVQAILATDAGGSAWTMKTSDDPSTREWIRGDQATASYDTVKHLIILTSPQMIEALRHPVPQAPLPDVVPRKASAAASKSPATPQPR